MTFAQLLEMGVGVVLCGCNVLSSCC